MKLFVFDDIRYYEWKYIRSVDHWHIVANLLL